MELKSDLFYIFLVAFYLFDVGEASSDDEREKSVEGEKHKWTSDEEIKLIFIDMLTDTGEKNHVRRIIEEWRKEYPELNVTDKALSNKIYKMRVRSLQEGQRRKNFKWSPEVEQELVDVYHTTRPYIKDAEVSLEEEWKRRYPEYQASGTYLIWRVDSLFRKFRYLRYRTPGSSIASSLVKDLAERINHRWTEHEKARLLHFHEVTSKGERTNIHAIRSMWHKEFPEINVTDYALLIMLRRLRRTPKKEGERKKYLIWTPEDEKMLLDTYLNTYPYKKDANVTFRELWEQRQEGSIGDEKYLMARARSLLKNNKYPEYSAREFQAGPSRIKCQKRKKFLPKMKEILRGRKDASPRKQSGKAPIVYSSEESASFSPPVTSENSE